MYPKQVSLVFKGNTIILAVFFYWDFIFYTVSVNLKKGVIGKAIKNWSLFVIVIIYKGYYFSPHSVFTIYGHDTL